VGGDGWLSDHPYTFIGVVRKPDRSPQELVQIKEKMEEHWAHKNAINLRIAEIQ
jgi:hypothetical protein